MKFIKYIYITIFVLHTTLLGVGCSNKQYNRRVEAMLTRIDTGVYVTKIDTLYLPPTEASITLNKFVVYKDTTITKEVNRAVVTMQIKDSLIYVSGGCKDTTIYVEKEVLRVVKPENRVDTLSKIAIGVIISFVLLSIIILFIFKLKL